MRKLVPAYLVLTVLSANWAMGAGLARAQTSSAPAPAAVSAPAAPARTATPPASDAKPAARAPRPPRTTRPAPAATAPTGIVSMPQLCRLREGEILQLNTLIRQRMAMLVQEKDEKKQADMTASYQAAKRLLVDAEESWDRLGCLTILYLQQSTLGR